MSNVTLQIGGRSFTVACAAGEEDHIAGLGRAIDSRLQAMGGAAGQTETRMLLFAALLLADELHDIRTKGTIPAPPPPVEDPKLAERLETLAVRLEKCATDLEALAGDA
ncbi:cell division protein ZapA [Novosphingobium flavum]|uniref:Cell division protein ZapA n=1 Tax=Novosphingobium aerophilum TaxID=2839843 RepID=A0A7X1F9C9_9SPHN|nr:MULTISPECIES: cell division protein ZapA [Novosphingobium]MBC2652827.1 cell division protein ZapA [Novosphingobium aerophilum]MBC2662477.1 cell division protein ZapA [Novosphingobium aerophilum]